MKTNAKKFLSALIASTTLLSCTAAINFNTAAQPANLAGDINGDNAVNSLDALLILQSTVDMVPLEDEQKLSADVDINGKIDSVDALKILRYTVKSGSGFISSFTAENPVLLNADDKAMIEASFKSFCKSDKDAVVDAYLGYYDGGAVIAVHLTDDAEAAKVTTISDCEFNTMYRAPYYYKAGVFTPLDEAFNAKMITAESIKAAYDFSTVYTAENAQEEQIGRLSEAFSNFRAASGYSSPVDFFIHDILPYDGNTEYCVIQWGLTTGLSYSDILDGYVFNYPNGSYRLMVLVNGKMTRVSQAYEKGEITKAELAKICFKYNRGINNEPTGYPFDYYIYNSND